MRALWAALPLLSAGCLGITPFFHVDEHEPPPVERVRMGSIGIATVPPDAFEPAASATFPTAGTLDWATGGTEAGMSFLGGALQIEDVRRDSPEGFLKVRARLRNRSDQAVSARWVIVFYDAWGVPLLSEQPDPQGFSLDPFAAATLSNGCRLPEAVFFRVHLMPPA